MAGKNKTLVAYATKGGATREAAEIISRVLKKKHKLDVDVVDIRKDKSPDIGPYANIVLGGGVRIGKVYKQVYRFLDNGLNGKRVALFTVCNEAGNPKSHDNAFNKYNKKMAEKYPNINFVESETFGGRMGIFGFSIQDVFDGEKVGRWAEKVGSRFSKRK